MPTASLTITIPSGSSLSPAVFIADGSKLERIVTPSDWSIADLTFQVSNDNVNFFDLFDQEGREVTAQITPGTTVVLDLKNQFTSTAIKLRSGNRQHPVKQPADRNFVLSIYEPPA
jgi:hypothetical protein